MPRKVIVDKVRADIFNAREIAARPFNAALAVIDNAQGYLSGYLKLDVLVFSVTGSKACEQFVQESKGLTAETYCNTPYEEEPAVVICGIWSRKPDNNRAMDYSREVLRVLANFEGYKKWVLIYPIDEEPTQETQAKDSALDKAAARFEDHAREASERRKHLLKTNGG